jgi:chromosome segregation ATPase
LQWTSPSGPSPLKGVMSALTPRMRLQLAEQRKNLGLSPKPVDRTTAKSPTNVTPVVLRELKSKSNLLQEKQAELKDKATKVEELQRRLAALDSNITSFRPMSLFSLSFDTENERLFSELDATKKELDNAKKEVFQDEKVIEALNSRIEDDWSSIRERLATSGQEFRKRDDEIRMLSAKLEASDLLIRSLEDQLAEVTYELDTRKEQEEDDAETMNDAAALLAAVDAERAALQVRLDAIEVGRSYEEIERENEHLKALVAAKTDKDALSLLSTQLANSEGLRRKMQDQYTELSTAMHESEKNGTIMHYMLLFFLTAN